jgi:hypothetical protein
LWVPFWSQSILHYGFYNSTDYWEPTYEEINTALSAMKKGKAADVFELTVENILYGGDELLYIIHKIIVAITREGHIPDNVF